MPAKSFSALTRVSASALAIALFVGVAPAAIAQDAAAVAATGSISGTVTDAGGTTLLRGATVRINELGLRTTTGSDGRYRFSDVPAGTYTLTIDYLNSASRSLSVNVTPDGSADVDVAMVAADEVASEEIIVLGTRGSLALARAQELAADQFKTIVSADSIGNFADQNVAESLQRLPGLSIRRSEGEGQQVAVRGLSGSFVTVTVDGAKLGTRDLDTRSVNLDIISSDLLNGIEVTKTLTPDLDADSIAGNVNLKTLSAFDRNKSQISLRGELGIQEKSSDVNEKVSGDITHIFGSNDQFGLAVSGSYQNRKAVVDEFSVDDGLRELAPGILSPRRFNLRNDPAERERISGNLNLEFRPSDEHKFFLRGTYAHFTDEDIRARTRVEFDDATGSRIRSFDENSIVVERVDVEKRFRFTDQVDELYAISGGGKNDFGALHLDYQVDYSSNTSDQPSVEPRFRERDVNASYDNLSIDGADFTLSPNPGRGADPTVPRNFQRRFVTQYDRFIDDEVFAARADLTYDADLLGAGGYFKVGAKYQRRKRSVEQDRFDIDIDDDQFDVDGDGIVTIADFSPSVPKDTDLNTGFFPSLGLTRRFAIAAAAAGRASGDFTELFAENNGFDYDVTEKIFSAYAMAKLQPRDNVQIIAGVRFESTRWRTNGNDTNVVSFDEDVSEALLDAFNAALSAGTATFTPAQRDAFLAGRFNEDGDTVEATAIVDPISASNSYTDFFPSVNVRWDISNELLGRFAYTTATRRPDFNQASAIFTTATTENTDSEDIPAALTSLAAAGSLLSFERSISDLRDPELSPLYAHQLDASLAWYPNKHTFFQVAGFYKRISNFIVPVVFSGPDLTQLGLPIGELATVNGFFTRTIDGGFNSVDTFINGDKAEVYGVEISGQQNFNFLPGFFSGLFVAGNLTLSDSKATDAQVGRKFTLPDQSKTTWNITAGWENEQVSVRWSGNYTGSRLIALNAGFLGLQDDRSDLLERSRFTMDVNVRVDVNDTLQIYFDALNINDAEDRNYFRGDPDNLGPIFNLIENYGATYQMGVRLRF
jgi:iron complex outermembrane recepter protein